MEYQEGQTPIDEEEKEGLRIKTISTKSELDEFEQLNNEEALQWIFTKKFKPKQVFAEKFICDLHNRMFGNVWDWAGRFRKTDKNIGIDKHQISIALKVLCDDSLFWVENEIYSPEEIALRFKHRLVSIHCFPNGNGRHSRVIGRHHFRKIIWAGAFFMGGCQLFQSQRDPSSVPKSRQAGRP